MKKCNKCDDRGMIREDKYSSHSCDCGESNRLMAKIFKGVSIEQLLAYGRHRIGEKKLKIN